MPAISPSLLAQWAAGSASTRWRNCCIAARDAITALCSDVLPGVPCVIVEHRRSGLRQIGQRRPNPACVPAHGRRSRSIAVRLAGPGCARPRTAGHSSVSDAMRSEFPDAKPLQIGRAAPGEMRARHSEMVEKLDQAGPDCRLILRFCGDCYHCSPRFPSAILHRETGAANCPIDGSPTWGPSAPKSSYRKPRVFEMSEPQSSLLTAPGGERGTCSPPTVTQRRSPKRRHDRRCGSLNSNRLSSSTFRCFLVPATGSSRIAPR